MFTGIIEAIGEIKKVTPLESGIRIEIEPGKLDLSDIHIGDSIATNGVCLTIIALVDRMLTMEVSRETLNCTQGLDIQGQRVNLEKAMRLSERINGHLVSGHVDGIGKVEKFEPVGESCLLAIKAPAPLLKYVVIKGSIAVNGVSLTVNSIEKDEFRVNLVSHTLTATALQDLKSDTKVNLEIDLLARYLEQLLKASK
ncbi:MAG: riboflavin synthase [Nitrosomonadaceae bacterium]|jgi:riboflavin synthase|nr:riboflavin synthase [Nitrosomonadaceae bacterium]